MWTSQVRETLQPLRSGLHVRSVSCAFGHDAFLSPGVRRCIGCQVAGPSEPLNMSKVLVVGVAVIHPVRGRGVVTAVNHQSERHKPYWISFENGEVHNYNESSAQKLRIASTAAAAERYVPGACDPSLRTSVSRAGPACRESPVHMHHGAITTACHYRRAQSSGFIVSSPSEIASALPMDSGKVRNAIPNRRRVLQRTRPGRSAVGTRIGVQLRQMYAEVLLPLICDESMLYA